MANTNIPSILEWQTLDSPPHDRSDRWYLWGAVGVLIGCAYGLLTGSFATALVFLLIGAIYFLLRRHAPRTITVRITGVGLVIDEELLPWNMVREFWILVGPTWSQLKLSPQQTLGYERTVLIPGTIDIGAVRQSLLDFIPERTGQGERAIDMLSNYFKL